MDISKELLIDILRDGCRAPSGDNAQPWRFRVTGNVLQVINAAEKDTSLFNWQQRTNHVALGACIENIRLSAGSHGYRADIALLPDAADEFVVAEIALVPNAGAKAELANQIPVRASNRRMYEPRPIEVEKLAALTDLSGDDGRIIVRTERDAINKLAHIVSAGEKLALENKSIHDFLFSHITWSKEEDAQKHGFLIDTFEFTPPQRAAFRFFSRWSILKLFLPLGISKAIAKDMERVHATAAAFGAVLTQGDTPQDFLRAGMLLERMWLTATSLGLSLQGVTAVGFLGPCVLAGEAVGLSGDHQRLLTGRYAELSNMYERREPEAFAFTFRLGYAEPPSAMTTRLEPLIEWA